MLIVAKGKSGNVEWTLQLDATKDGDGWRGKKLTVVATGVVAEATLAEDLIVPAPLVKDDESRLLTRAEIEGKAIVARDEFVRRYRRVELEWNGQFFGMLAPFGANVGAQMFGYARLHLAQLLGPDAYDAGAALFELVLVSRVDADAKLQGAAVTFKAGVGLAVILYAAKLPELRFDLEDLDLTLPKVELPALSLPDVGPVKLPKVDLSQLSRLFGDVTVSVTPEPSTDEPVLVLKDLTTTPSWALMKSDQSARQEFLVIVKQKAEIFRIEKFTIAHNGTTLEIGGTLTLGTQFELPDGAQELGPLRLQWEGVKITPRLRKTFTDDGAQFDALVEFNPLILSSREDPSAELKLKGKIVLTRHGIAVEELEVFADGVAHKLLVLIDRLARGTWRVLSSIDTGGGAGPNPDVLKKLLAILGKIAAAASKAAGFLGEAVGQLLTGIARAVGALFEGLAKLAVIAKDNLVFEIRLRLDPFEVLQVIVSSRREISSAPFVIGGAALEATVHDAWRPAVLLDFVTQPGVYLLAVPKDPAKPEIATIATDLWLRAKDAASGKDSVSAVRDADATGDRAQAKRVFSLTAKHGGDRIVVLAGVRRGAPVFLHQLEELPKKIDIGGGNTVVAAGDELAMKKFDPALDVAFEKDRALALLGLGDPGEKTTATPGDGFIDKLQQVIWVEKVGKDISVNDRKAKFDIDLGVKVGGLKAFPKVRVELSLDDLSLDVTGGQTLDIEGEATKGRALGLDWEIRPKDPTKDRANLFRLTLGNPSGLELHSDAVMELRYADLSNDGRGLVFTVQTFRAGRGGIDLFATIGDQSVRLNGLDVPFRFNSGSLRLAGGQLIEATVSGKGKLPPDLIGDAGASIALTFAQENDAIVLQSGTAQIDKAGEPIVCHSTRFTLTLSHLGLDFVRENGQVHFYFLLTGSAQFTPKEGELKDGLLKYLGNIRINLQKAPLTGDASVLIRHINFQIAIKPKLRFNLFELFTFEVRGIGFHPSAPKFGGAPAMNISGQIAFADIGDVMQPKIDFHGLWIAPPAEGESLPRVRADGLGVDIGLSGTARIGGSVIAVDDHLSTLEGTELAPPEYKTNGFLGEGRLALDGFTTMAASFGFLEVRPPGGELRKCFFLFLQKQQIAYKIPTPIWPLWLREVGFGFGFRYTLEGIKAAEKATSVAELIRTLDEVATRQGELASFAAWRPDVEKDNVTLALHGALQIAPAEEKWDEKKEEKTPNPFLFDITAALRSDMTFLMSLRGWPNVNYFDFFHDTDGLRTNPFFIGYLYISAPRSELLARFVSKPEGYIGKKPMFYPMLEQALKAVEFSSTLYIAPGIFHHELGWPDQLRVTLFKDPNFRADVRGGMVFRVWDGALLTGYNIEANAFLKVGGRAGGDSLGVEAVASLSAAFVARFIAYLDFSSGKYLFYGLAAIDASLDLRISAWLHLNFRFFKVDISLSFSFSIQLSIAVELAIAETGVGAQANVRVAISVFGATLSVGVGFTIAGGELAAARARVQRFMSMSLTADAPEPTRRVAAARNEEGLQKRAEESKQAASAPVPAPVKDQPVKDDEIRYADLGRAIEKSDFWLVLRKIGKRDAKLLPADKEFVLAMLVPKDGGFYAGGAEKVSHDLKWPPLVTDAYHVDPTTHEFVPITSATLTLEANLTAVHPKKTDITLRSMLNACFLIDAKVVENDIEVTKWHQPRPRAEFARTSRQQATDSREQAHERGREQSAFRALTAQEGEVVTAVRDARTTLLAHFIEQFTAAADTGDMSGGVHIADFGLVFAVPRDRVAELASLTVTKSDAAGAGAVELLNPPDRWFDASDPVLKDVRTDVQLDGIKLDWDLEPLWADDSTPDPEHLLHHYEIERVMEGRELVRRTFRIKPSCTPGSMDGKKIRLVKPAWQFTDDLSDQPEQFRQALLPKGGPDSAPIAAAAWLDHFQDDQEVTVAYTVTPVDVAGTRGLSRTILVEIDRPDVPIRPPVGRLIVELPRNPLKNASPAPDQLPAEKPKVILALSDPHWDGPLEENKPKEWAASPDKKLARGYRLIFDPEEIVQSGAFGSDGLTTRPATPGAGDAPLETADEIVFELSRSDETFGDASAAIEEKERETFAFWRDLSKAQGKTKDGKPVSIAQALWSRIGNPKRRVAVRAYLQTTLSVGEGANPVRLASRRVPVDFELRVRPAAADPTQVPIALRPQAFEWPTRVDYAPLAEGRVRARAGLAYFRGPSPQLESIAKPLGDPAAYLDPLRRTLTEIVWSAAPEDGPPQLAGGYDLFELDLDELAPSDPAAARARRMARVHLLRRSAAALTPGMIEDPTAWQAHMPSEVWRSQRKAAAASARRGSLPLKRGWYSTRESLLQWPAAIPRRILLDRVDDGIVEALLQNGPPEKLVVTLEAGGIKRDLSLASRGIYRTRVEAGVVIHETVPLDADLPQPKDDKIEAKADETLSSSQIRRALFCLQTLAAVPLDGAVLRVEAHIGERSTTQTIELRPDPRLHPLLAETVELLGWARDGAIDYRRYEVVVEPPAPLHVKTLDALFAATDPEKDPYGWMTLGALGLAASIKLYDADLGDFVDPSDVIDRVRTVFANVLERYGEDAGAAATLDVFLRPGRDRLAGDPDHGVGKTTIDPDSDALAFVQISLRPRPLQVMKYAWVVLPRGKVTIALTDKIAGPVDVIRIADRTSISLTADAPKQELVPLPESMEPKIRLLVRVPATADDVPKLFAPGPEVCKLFDDPVTADETFAELETVFEHPAFAELDPAVLAAFIAADKSQAREALARFCRHAPRIPELVIPPRFIEGALTAAELAEFATPYVAWIQRFLEHTLLPGKSSGYSLCAPVRQQPWKLAAAADGSLLLSFLHEDRFAHARAYAVRPMSRYHDLVAAVLGQRERARLESLDGASKVGYAVAVAPRTARLETPTILSSRTIESSGQWQLVVARHPEQDLILSNRSLFARLGYEGTAMTWLQDYPTPLWPKKLGEATGIEPDYTIAPVPARPEPKALEAIPALTGGNLAAVAQSDPKLWKGAEIYRVARLPHHLRVTALVTARAGIVVSGIGYASHIDFEFVLPDKLENRRLAATGQPAPIEPPQWSLRSDGGTTFLVFTFSALSYADLMPGEVFAAWTTKGKDVAFWPDPGVVYVLARESQSPSGARITEDEAEVLAVLPEEGKNRALFALRARGPSWTAHDVAVSAGGTADQPLFALTIRLLPAGPLRAFALRFDDPIDPAKWTEFLGVAGAFAEIEPDGATHAVMRLRKLPDENVRTSLAALTDPDSKTLVGHFHHLVRDAVLDGAHRWQLRAEKGKAKAQSRDIGSVWS